MPDIVNRDELERKFGREIAKVYGDQLEVLLKKIGNPPRLENLPPEFWQQSTAGLLTAIAPFLEKVYLDQAAEFLGTQSIGVDWALVNQAASDWASRYSFDLVSGITANSRAALQTAVSNYYQTGQTIGALEQSLTSLYGPVRASAISVTEITRASVEGEQGLIDQILRDNQSLQDDPVWNTNNDSLVCPVCGPRNGKRLSSGAWTDPPPAHPRCLPGDALVLPIGGVDAASERQYEGDIIVIDTLEYHLSCTPNHPILTRQGWVGAGALQEGDNIFCYTPEKWRSFLLGVNDEQPISPIKDIFSAFDFPDFWVPTSPPDFHGDGGQSKIAVIRSNSKVVDKFKGQQPISQLNFIGRDITHLPLQSGGMFDFAIKTMDTPAGGIMGRSDLISALLRGHGGPFESLGLGLVTGLNTGFQQTLTDSPAIDTEGLSNAIFGFSGGISLQNIVKIRKEYFTGHVYNLQTESGLIVADGIITHNCRCWLNHKLTVRKT